jgi:hypothetical protein
MNYRHPLSMKRKCWMRGRYFGWNRQPVVPTKHRGVVVTALYHDRELNCRMAILIFLSFFPRYLQRIPEQFTKIGYDHLYVLPNCKRVIWRVITRVVKALQTPTVLCPEDRCKWIRLLKFTEGYTTYNYCTTWPCWLNRRPSMTGTRFRNFLYLEYIKFMETLSRRPTMH